MKTVLVALGELYQVGTPAELVPWMAPVRPWGSLPDTLLFALLNKYPVFNAGTGLPITPQQIADHTLTLIVQTSQDGDNVDGLSVGMETAAPGFQASVQVGPGNLRRWWRVLAHSADPGYLVTPCTLEMVADLR